MNFEERVKRLVRDEYHEMLELMQDSEDRTNDLLDAINSLRRTIPLIEDIKTEVSSIEKKMQQPESDDQTEEKNPQRDDTDDPDLLEFLREISKQLLLQGDVPRYLPDGSRPPLLLPGPGGSNKRTVNPLDILNMMFYVYKKVKSLEDKISDKIADAMAKGKMESAFTEISEIHKHLFNMDDYVHRSLDQLSDDLTECCEQTSEAIQNCCEQTSTDLSTIKRLLQSLDPASQGNKDLALQSRSRAILAECQAIRGLL